MTDISRDNLTKVKHICYNLYVLSTYFCVKNYKSKA